MIVELKNNINIITPSTKIQKIILYHDPTQAISIPCKPLEWKDNTHKEYQFYATDDKYSISSSSLTVQKSSKDDNAIWKSIELLYDDTMNKMHGFLLDQRYSFQSYNVNDRISSLNFVQAFLVNYYFLGSNSIKFSSIFQRMNWEYYMNQSTAEHPEIVVNNEQYKELHKIIITELINIKLLQDIQYSLLDIEDLFSLTSKLDISKLKIIR